MCRYRYLETELTDKALEVKKTLDEYVEWYSNVKALMCAIGSSHKLL